MIKTTTLMMLLLITSAVGATVVRFETNFGNIDLEMKETEAPLTVANFLTYVNDGDYDNSIIHRSIPNFVIQGGALYSDGNQIVEIPANPPVQNEFNLSNVRGTVAMAKLNNQPNSATNNFFVNLRDNSANLDSQNGGFTVFAEVVAGMEIVDLISSLQTFSDFPLFTYLNGAAVQLDDYIYINKAFVLSDDFQVNAGLSGSWFNQATSGQGFYFEMLPALNGMLVAWFTYDTFFPADDVAVDVGSNGHRWMTIEGTFDENNVYNGTLILTQGGIFDANDPVSSTAYGTVTIVFTDCNTATLTYTITGSGLSGTIPLKRQTPVNVALCERLASEANQG